MNYCKNHDKCIEQVIKNVNQFCDSNNLKLTKLREQILRIICQNHKSIKAYEILDQLQKQQIKDTPPKPPIVYRILDFFIENKIVHKINSNNSYIICSHLDKHQNCYFLICNECGLVEECCNEELKKAILHTTSKNDFLEQNISLEIMGLCKNCQNKL